MLWLGEAVNLICNFYLSVAARIYADPSLRFTVHVAGNQETSFTLSQLHPVLTNSQQKVVIPSTLVEQENPGSVD